MAMSAVSAVVGRIGELAAQETSLLCNVTGEVGLLKNELQRLQGFLQDADNQMRSGNKTIAVCVHQLRDASYEAENIVEAAEYVKKRSMLKKGFMGAISRYAGLPSDLVSLHKVDSQIRDVRRKISQIKDDMSALNIANLGAPRLHSDDGVHIRPQCFEDYDVVVGFEDEYREIVGKLLDEESSLSVISVVAMGGAGKTTLARKVYNSSRVKVHFEQVIWVAVSQNLKVIDLLNGILEQIAEAGDPLEATDKKEEGKVGKKIHDSLLGKTYLLVLDDVWKTDTWEQMKRSVKVFPDDKNGSRVLLTTRKKGVARHIQMPTYIHHLKLLGEEKSWELFSRKALPSYNRSKICDLLPKFEKLGRKLAKKCNGLPLALTVLGGYLSKNPNIEAWSDLLLDWTTTEDGQMMGNILARSYNDLSDGCLKYCFLFLASFPEDHGIPISDLIELWIAECFIIPHSRGHTLEETARTYVNELAQRSLIQVHGRSREMGWTANVRIHDILRDWCIEEARRDGFLGVVDKTAGAGGVATSSSDAMTSYRYCFHDFRDDQVFQAIPNLRTLIGFRLSVLSLPKMRFLRVLHLENSTVMNLSMLIGGCVHLRCLRLRKCTSATIPSSITQLLYLQTIDLRGTVFKSILPNTIWAINTLRHVYLSFQSYPTVNTKQDPMPILEKLPCLVVLHFFDCQGRTMSCSVQGFPQLQELELGGLSTEWRIEDGAMPKLSHLALWSWNMSKLPEGLLRLPSLMELELVDMHMISTYDITWKKLEGKGCKVKTLEAYEESEEQRKIRLKEEEVAKAIMRQANTTGWLPCSTKK